jgi:hypothetical protein
MSAMALTISSAGAVSGLDTHVFVGAGTTAQARYYSRSLRLSTHAAVQETLLSRFLAGNVSTTSGSGQGFGSGRRKGQGSGNGNKRRVFCRCEGSGEVGKDDSDGEQRNEEISDEVVGTSGSGNQPRQKKSQVCLLTFYTLARILITDILSLSSFATC